MNRLHVPGVPDVLVLDLGPGVTIVVFFHPTVVLNEMKKAPMERTRCAPQQYRALNVRFGVISVISSLHSGHVAALH